MLSINKKICILVASLIVIIGVLFFYLSRGSGYKLVITDITNRQDPKTYEFKMKKNEFILGYIHSVNKTPCEEFFSADKDHNILLKETTYQSYGVGLPFLPEEGKMEIKDGKFVLKINRSFKSINMVVSSIAKHYLIIDGKRYDLNQFLGEDPAKIALIIEKD